MLGEVGACIAYFDELHKMVVRDCDISLLAPTTLTPVPLSTTRGTEGSMVEAELDDALAARRYDRNRLWTLDSSCFGT